MSLVEFHLPNLQSLNFMIRISVCDLEEERRGEEGRGEEGRRGDRGGEGMGDREKIPKNPLCAESFIPVRLLNIKSDPTIKI